MNYRKVGQRIRTERMKFNLSREKFAELLELSPNFVGQIERGEKKMSIDTLIKISDSLHVSIDYLLKGNVSVSNDIADDEIRQLLNKCSKRQKALISEMIKMVLPHIKK